MASVKARISTGCGTGFVFQQWFAISLVLINAAVVQAGERKVLTIGMDGLRPDALIAANAPNVDSLFDGTFFGTGGPSGIFVTVRASRSTSHSAARAGAPT